MKTNILRLIVLVISISCVTMLSAQEKSLRKYTMMDGVECVNLSKELLSLIPASKDSKFEGFVDKIDNVQIIKTQKKKLVKKFKKEWPKVLETEDYNSIMSMNQDGKNKRRGMVVGKTAKTKKAIVTLTEDSKEIEIFAGL